MKQEEALQKQAQINFEPYEGSSSTTTENQVIDSAYVGTLGYN